MVLDALENARLYVGMSERIATALRYLQTTDLRTLSLARHEIDGAALYATVFDYDTKPRETGFWEAHRQYIDVQYIISGVEMVGHANLAQLTPGTYDAARDFLVAEGPGNFFQLAAGSFVIFHPEDAHMPGLAVAAPAPVRKIVVKVAVV